MRLTVEYEWSHLGQIHLDNSRVAFPTVEVFDRTAEKVLAVDFVNEC